MGNQGSTAPTVTNHAIARSPSSASASTKDVAATAGSASSGRRVTAAPASSATSTAAAYSKRIARAPIRQGWYPPPTTMPEVVDLHAHVLPGVDDGPASADESVELARRAAADGVTTLAATPHLRDDHPGVVPEELARRTAELGRLLDREGVGLALVPGGEVDLTWALDAGDDVLRLVSYGQRGSDLLVETPYGELPQHFERMIDAVRWRGYRVLLAHPERNPSFQRSPERLADLVDRGVLVQLTAASLARPRGSRSGRLARAAVSEGMAHVIASDAHGSAHPGPGRAGGGPRPGLRARSGPRRVDGHGRARSGPRGRSASAAARARRPPAGNRRPRSGGARRAGADVLRPRPVVAGAGQSRRARATASTE